jgi:hypothetical protein
MAQSSQSFPTEDNLMQLTPSQVSRFYGIWFPLLKFVNSKKKVVSPSLFKEPINPADILPVRDALWADDSLLEMFARENPAALSSENLAIVRSWRSRVEDTFYVVKHLKKYSIFLTQHDDESSDEELTRVYGVLGLASSLDETLMFDPPCALKTVLIPFEGQITYDSLLVSYPISFGRNVTGRLNRTYQSARKSGVIIESLERTKLTLVR